MTDKDIIKALEICTKQGDCKNCLFGDDGDCGVTLLNLSYDLINRLQARVEKCEKVERFADKTIATLQAENKRLSTLAELGNKRADDYRVMRDRALKAEKEVERLKKGWKADVILTADTKAEAYKEFAERLKENSIATFSFKGVVMVEEIDNLLKELVGEEI